MKKYFLIFLTIFSFIFQVNLYGKPSIEIKQYTAIVDMGIGIYNEPLLINISSTEEYYITVDIPSGLTIINGSTSGVVTPTQPLTFYLKHPSTLKDYKIYTLTIHICNNTEQREEIMNITYPIIFLSRKILRYHDKYLELYQRFREINASFQSISSEVIEWSNRYSDINTRYEVLLTKYENVLENLKMIEDEKKLYEMLFIAIIGATAVISTYLYQQYGKMKKLYRAYLEKEKEINEQIITREY